jgi:CDP-diacylglycerol--serine O-phosphatidyltransferase
MRVPPEMVLPVFVSVIFFIALLIGYHWHILSAGSVIFLLSLPLGWKSYRDQARAAATSTAAPAGVVPANPAAPFAPAIPDDAEDDRPERLH